jgi:hypothetical protein
MMKKKKKLLSLRENLSPLSLELERSSVCLLFCYSVLSAVTSSCQVTEKRREGGGWWRKVRVERKQLEGS